MIYLWSHDTDLEPQIKVWLSATDFTEIVRVVKQRKS